VDLFCYHQFSLAPSDAFTSAMMMMLDLGVLLMAKINWSKYAMLIPSE